MIKHNAALHSLMTLLPAKRPRGRPRLFDETRRQTLCTLISVGLSRKEACRQVGVKPSSIVHAARTDAVFAGRLQQALIDRANRPPELADIGSHSWRAVARRLEARSSYFQLSRSQPKHALDDPRLRRAIRRMVRKLLRKHLPVAPASSRRHCPPDYCSENPPLMSAHTETKTIIAAANPIIVS